MAKDDKEQERGPGTDSGDDDRGRFVDSDDFGLDAGSDDAVTDRDDDVLPPLSGAGAHSTAAQRMIDTCLTTA